MTARQLRIGVVAGLALLSVISPAMLPGAASSTSLTTTNKFVPQLLIRVGSSPVIYVVGSVACQRRHCLKLLRTFDDGATFADVTPPPTKPAKDSPLGSLDQIVFANAEVGFALEGDAYGEGAKSGTTLYATFNGARTWKKVREPVGDALSRIAVTSNALYGITMHCAKQTNGNEGCLDYRLAHASLKVQHWTSSPIPNGRSYPWGFLGGVAAYGSTVWMTEGAKWSLLVTSHDHGTTFSTYTPKFPALASVAGCGLSAFSPMALWAECPTGMEVSFAFSSDGGTKWTPVPSQQFMGTGGGYFDPVSSTLAYLDFGGTRPLYRVSDAGHRMTEVGRLQCSSINSSVNALVFTTERRGLAICLPGDDGSLSRLERTTDGGATWHRIAS